MIRRFAIADIHGCAATFAALLAKINLQRRDTLYLLGDYIDRGPDSKWVLDRILELIGEGFDLKPLLGNHEQLLLDALSDQAAFSIWKGNGGYETLQQFGVNHPAKLPNCYIDFLISLPLIYVLEDFVLVHAGLDFRKGDPIAETAAKDLLWVRDYRCDAQKLAGRTLITGHSMTPLFAIRESLATNHIKLDNGCYDNGEMGQGALVALDLNNRELVVVQNMEK